MADNGILKRPESASDEEKAAASQRDGGVSRHVLVSDLPPDPDAHLSPEERAAIVSDPTCATLNVC